MLTVANFCKFGSQRAQSRRFVAVIIGQKYVCHGEGKREAIPDELSRDVSGTYLGYAIFASETKRRSSFFSKPREP